MKIYLLLLILFLAGCNSQEAKLSSLGNVTGPINQLPQISSFSPLTISRNTTVSTNFTISDAESPLTCTGSVFPQAINTSLLPTGSLTISGTAPNCILTLQPALNATGTSNILLEVFDGEKYVGTWLSVTVIGGIPTATNLSLAGSEDANFVAYLSYSDAENDLATSCSINPGTNLQVITACSCVSGSCSATLRGILNYNGSTSFTYTVTDIDGTSAPATVATTIVSVDDSPIAQSATGTMNEDSSITLTLPYQDADNDPATACTISSLTGMTAGPCTCAAGVCSANFAGTTNFNGTGSGLFQVTANGVTSGYAGVNITINAVNDAPTITAIANQTRIINGTYPNIAFTISDVDNTISCGGNVTVSSTNTLLITGTTVSGTGTSCTLNPNPSVNALGSSNITVTVTDGAVSNSTTFTLSMTGWGQAAYIKAANNNAADYFGKAIYMSGDTLVVGAPEEDSNQTTITNGTTASADNSATSAGAVYVYSLSGANWMQEAYIKAGNANSSDFFGTSLAIFDDTIAVGAYGESSNQTTITNGTTSSTDNSYSQAGAVYIYRRSSSTWSQEAYIKAPNTGSGDWFGKYVALDRETLVVGAPQEDNTETGILSVFSNDDNLTQDSGAVYVYTRTSGNWSLQAYLKADNQDTGDLFGKNFSLSGDILAVGVPDEDSSQTTTSTSGSTDNSLPNAGAVYVFSRSSGSWAQTAYLKAPNVDATDAFGTSVSVYGNKIAIGAPGEDSSQNTISTTAPSNNSGSNNGAVYIFSTSGSGSWSLEAFIKPSTDHTQSSFGNAVSLKANMLVVGTDQEDNMYQKIQNSNTAPTFTTDNNVGAAYVFRSSGSSWSQEAYLKPTNLGSSDYFGYAVAQAGDKIAVAAYEEDSNQTTITKGAVATTDNSSSGSGAVYIFRNPTSLFDVTETWATVSSITATIYWKHPGGTATTFYVKYASGTTVSACTTSDNNTTGTSVQATGLSSATSYTFRICAWDGTTMTSGAVLRIKTASSGLSEISTNVTAP